MQEKLTKLLFLGPKKKNCTVIFKVLKNIVELKKCDKKIHTFLNKNTGLKIEQVLHWTTPSYVWSGAMPLVGRGLLRQMMTLSSSTLTRKTIALTTMILSSSALTTTRDKSIRQILNTMMVVVVEDFSSFYLTVSMDVERFQCTLLSLTIHTIKPEDWECP